MYEVHFANKSGGPSCDLNLISINARMTLEQFDDLTDDPKYRLDQHERGWNAAGIAAWRGNHRLVTHIVQKAPDTLDLKDGAHMTPLFLACASDQISPALRFDTIATLLQLGADINCAAGGCKDSRPGYTIPTGATPLWAAAQTARSVECVALLLNKGAHLGNEPLPPEGQATLHQGHDLLNQKRDLLKASVMDATKMINDVCGIVTAYAEIPIEDMPRPQPAV